MTNAEQREAARRFINTWKGKGDEKSDAQSFWISLLSNVLDIESVTDKIEFEKKVVIDGQTKYIDAYIPEARVLIEQKSYGKDLSKAIPQSGGKLLTPYEQAKNYANNMPVDDAPRWIVTCNFEEFHVYDMNKPGAAPEIILLENLQTEIYRFDFLLNEKVENISKEMEISIQAGDLVGKLYDALLKEYKDPTNADSLKSLNALCVRLVFCLYAEDAGIFGRHGMFHDYLMRFEIRDLRKALIELFQVLDIKPEERDPYMDAELAAFPYVNGGLFSDANIEIPQFTEEIRELILKKASEDFDWSEISPTIFGAVFESTLNPETRRAGGMHYTSIENIHKVIDPLFLDGLNEELEEIRTITVARTKKSKLEDFQNKLAGLNFLDPACGSGNFLTESYIALRKIENEILMMKMELEKGQVAGQIMLGDLEGIENPIKVSIGQFYGIEINDFAVTVAKTALWIAESQMMKATEDVIHLNLDFLPLKSYANIVEGNALRMDWNDVISKDKLDYIMGNPPFVANSGRVSSDDSHSKKMISDEQAEDRFTLFGKDGGLLDYVACWYKKAALIMKDTYIQTAFVSTDSITQGQQVEPLWKTLLDDGLQINFAHRSFKWKNDSNEKSALVYVVIIGISYIRTPCKLFVDSTVKQVPYINAYLIDAPNVIVQSRSKPLCKVPNMRSGGKPVEGGFLIFSDKEKEEFLKKEPQSEKYFRRFTSGESFINNKMQWCLWIPDISPKEIRDMPEVRKRIEQVREFRLSSKKEATRKGADYPNRFMEIKQPDNDYLIIPLTTSRNRRYVPIGYLDKDVIANNGASFVPDATTYHFGVLTSNVHMGWMRAVCGYFGPSYRYSNKIVYNNFPWPSPTEEQKNKIEETAKAILEVRAKFPDSSLKDLYDPLLMPIELRKAHQANDRAVMQAYGFNIKEMSEADCVAELMKMYQGLVE
ncbi:MAG: DNA methyltransferase [Eubacterium sp.]|nr:DNA methyltransferase [Eubacterium sp.]